MINMLENMSFHRKCLNNIHNNMLIICKVAIPNSYNIKKKINNIQRGLSSHGNKSLMKILRFFWLVYTVYMGVRTKAKEFTVKQEPS